MAKKLEIEGPRDAMFEAGPRATAIRWAGEQEKHKEIMDRLGDAILEISGLDLSRDTFQRVFDERIEQAVRELAEVGESF
jgi:hypothetical protein